MAHTGLVFALLNDTGVVFRRASAPSRVTHAARLDV
jgi:hypothetical protein